MPIKKTPICPICNSEMEKVTPLNIPTDIEAARLEFESTKEVPRQLVYLKTDSGERAKVITQSLVYRAWKCQCGFVALFDGEPK